MLLFVIVVTFNNRLHLANQIRWEAGAFLRESTAATVTVRPQPPPYHVPADPTNRLSTRCVSFFFFPTVHRKCRPLPLRDGGWLVIREGQIASLGLPAICRPTRLIPPRGPGLPGSGLPSPSVSLHAVSPTSLQKPSLQCPTASHQC